MYKNKISEKDAVSEKDVDQIANYVMRAAQLAAVLEVSGWPKPGNVHRTADFEDTNFEQFLAGSIALGPAVRDVALQGVRARLREIEVYDIGLGGYIRHAVDDVRAWHRGGNTHLGVSLLFVPLGAAAGYTLSLGEEINPGVLRDDVRRIMEASSPRDAVEAYRAINEANSAALGRIVGLGVPDLLDENYEEAILEGGLSLFQVMKASMDWDNIAWEWATGMEISFKTGYPCLRRTFEETQDINTATVHTFLTILSLHPDTLIARKLGSKESKDIREATRIGRLKAREVSRKAKDVLNLGGFFSDKGRKALQEMDTTMRSLGEDFNPGTTADLTASSLMIAILCGLRP